MPERSDAFLIEPVSGVKALRHTKSLVLEPDKRYQAATFTNGMRSSADGHGRMNHDYLGTILPLLPEFGAAGKGQRTTPWMVRGSFYDLLLDGHSRLDVEIHDFLSYMARSDTEIRGRNLCKTRVIAVIDEFGRRYPGYKINIYGSERTALGLPLSDIDITIDIPSLGDRSNPYAARERYIPALKSLKDLFDSKHIVSRSTVREGKIPLLEIEDAETGIEIDISFDEKKGTSSASSIEQVKRWKTKYGEDKLLPLVILLKHALGMRRLGLGAATELYQGGVGSYLLLCMVVVFLEHQTNQTKENMPFGDKSPTISYLFISLLKFWGVDFDYGKHGIAMEPPQIVAKSGGIEPYIFEVRKGPMPDYDHLGSGTFGIKHIKETMRFFYESLSEQVRLYDNRSMATTPEHPGMQISGDGKRNPSEIFGLLGVIMGGKYQWFEERRRRIVRAADNHERQSTLPPHIRLQIGRHHQNAVS